MHALGALPYLLLLACPLMHLFMHHGHGGHHTGAQAPTGQPKTPTDRPTAGWRGAVACGGQPWTAGDGDLWCYPPADARS